MVRRVLTQSIVRAAVRGCSVFLCASCWRTELPVPKSGLWQPGKRPAELPNNNSTAATASNDSNNGGGDIATANNNDNSKRIHYTSIWK